MIGRFLERFKDPLDQLSPELRSLYSTTLDAAKDPNQLATALDGIERIENTDPQFEVVFGNRGLEKKWEQLAALLMDVILAPEADPALLEKAMQLYVQALTTIQEGKGSVVDSQLRRAANCVPNDELSKRPAINPNHERVQQLFQAIFARYGLDFFTTWDAWQNGYSRSAKTHGPLEVAPDVMRRFHAAQNFRALRELEHRQAGSAKILQKRFGVFYYSRYPTELLVDQVSQMDNQAVPYGVVIGAQDDHNGTLYGERDFYASLYNQMQGRYQIRVFECGSKRELAKRMLQVEADYNKPASFVVVSSHGNVDKIALGKNNTTAELITIDDVVHPTFVKGSKRFLEPNAQVILTGCATGVNDGIAEQYARNNDVVVHAANHVVSKMHSVNVQFRAGEPPAFRVKAVGRLRGIPWNNRVIDLRQPE